MMARKGGPGMPNSTILRAIVFWYYIFITKMREPIVLLVKHDKLYWWQAGIK